MQIGQRTKKGNERLSQFQKKNPDFDFLHFNFNHPGAIAKLDFGGLEPEVTIETLKTFQRLLRVYPSKAVADALDEAGLRSAHEIASIPEHQFVRQYAKTLEGRDGKDELAHSVHRSAANIVERARLHAMSLATLADPVLADMPADNMSGLLNFYSGLPGYQELFGNLNYLQCEECQSIWSPAAYFIDLLSLVDGYVTKPKNEQLSLAARRPDLWQIPLDCESTNQEVPYLQIVNQILEAQVTARFKKSLFTGLQPTGARDVLRFDGTTTYIHIPKNPFLVPNFSASPITYAPPTQFTICAWVNPALISGTNYAYVCGMKDNDNDNNVKPAMYIPASANDLCLWVGGLDADSNPAYFSQDLSDFFPAAGAWVHIAWVFDIEAATSTLYRNGEMFGTPSQMDLK